MTFELLLKYMLVLPVVSCRQDSTLTATASPSAKETQRTSPGTTEYDEDDYSTEYDCEEEEEVEVIPPIAGKNNVASQR